jgi:hypothetical protein
MGKDMEPSKKCASRRLTCDDPRIRNKYISNDETYIKRRDIRNEERELQNSMLKDGWSERNAQKYEKLHELQQVGVEAAHKTCHILNTGGGRLVTAGDSYNIESSSRKYHAIERMGQGAKAIPHENQH